MGLITDKVGYGTRDLYLCPSGELNARFQNLLHQQFKELNRNSQGYVNLSGTKDDYHLTLHVKSFQLRLVPTTDNGRITISVLLETKKDGGGGDYYYATGRRDNNAHLAVTLKDVRIKLLAYLSVPCLNSLSDGTPVIEFWLSDVVGGRASIDRTFKATNGGDNITQDVQDGLCDKELISSMWKEFIKTMNEGGPLLQLKFHFMPVEQVNMVFTRYLSNVHGSNNKDLAEQSTIQYAIGMANQVFNGTIGDLPGGNGLRYYASESFYPDSFPSFDLKNVVDTLLRQPEPSDVNSPSVVMFYSRPNDESWDFTTGDGPRPIDVWEVFGCKCTIERYATNHATMDFELDKGDIWNIEKGAIWESCKVQLQLTYGRLVLDRDSWVIAGRRTITKTIPRWAKDYYDQVYPGGKYESTSTSLFAMTTRRYIHRIGDNREVFSKLMPGNGPWNENASIPEWVQTSNSFVVEDGAGIPVEATESDTNRFLSTWDSDIAECHKSLHDYVRGSLPSEQLKFTAPVTNESIESSHFEDQDLCIDLKETLVKGIW